MSLVQWRPLNSLLIMQKVVQVATTVISSAYPGGHHWLNTYPVHAVCCTHAFTLDIRGLQVINVVEVCLYAGSRSSYSLVCSQQSSSSRPLYRHTSMHVDLVNPPLAKAIVRGQIRCSHSFLSFQSTQHAGLSCGNTTLGLFECFHRHRLL